jgi:hypothetical protein
VCGSRRRRRKKLFQKSYMSISSLSSWFNISKKMKKKIPTGGRRSDVGSRRRRKKLFQKSYKSDRQMPHD